MFILNRAMIKMFWKSAKFLKLNKNNNSLPLLNLFIFNFYLCNLTHWGHRRSYRQHHHVTLDVNITVKQQNAFLFVCKDKYLLFLSLESEILMLFIRVLAVTAQVCRHFS